MDIILLFGTLLLCIVIGMPIAYALGLGALVGAMWVGVPFEAVMLKIADGVSGGAVLTLPLFVTAAALIAEGGAAQRMIAFAALVRGQGGMPAATIAATTVMSGLSGAPVADASAFGAAAIPQMARAGYRRAYATDVAIAASVPAALMPPSLNAVLYSLAAGGTVSIAGLFLAGALPGLLLCIALMGLCLHIARRDKHPSSEAVPLRAALRAGRDAAWGAFTIVILVGGLLLGLTPLEAAAAACVWALFVTMAVYRDVRWHDLPDLVHRTVKLIVMVMLLVAMAASFSYVMSLSQASARIAAFFLSLSRNPFVFLLLINIVLLALGCLIDAAPLILIATPVLLPVAATLGVDPLHFGTVMLLNFGIGMVMPPLGATLFIGATVGNARIADVLRGIWPFCGVMLAALVVVTFVPSLSLWLPGLAK